LEPKATLLNVLVASDRWLSGEQGKFKVSSSFL
jgi:hypothetical protein